MTYLLKPGEQPKQIMPWRRKGTKFTLPDDLYTYQKEDYKKQLNGKSWFNFSEMGTGKTPTTLAIVEASGAKCPLILCPNSIRLEWVRQIEDWVGEGLSVTSNWDKLQPIVYSFVKNNVKYRILNYEVLRKKEHREVLELIPWDFIVMDEIHKTRNPKTKLVKGLWEFLPKISPECKIIGLSGSPLMNHPADLYVPLSIIHPEKYKRDLQSWRYFMYQYCFWADGQFGPYVYGTRNMEKLREETKPFVIRRTKKEVLPFLPEKYYRRVLLEMQPDQKKLYKDMEEQLAILLDTGEPLYSTNVLTTLTRLRQINLDPTIVGATSSSAKTDFIIDTLESIGDEKVVIFSCFEKYIELLEHYLIHLNIPYVTVTGLVKVEERAERVKRFQNDPSIKVFLGTVQTAGEGITLTAASTVIICDRWWNQPVVDQSVDRLHRIGQHNAVQVILPIVKDSVDELLDQILDRKDKYTQDYYGESAVKRMVLEERGLLRSI